jgi:hypothetical protein
MTTAESIHIYQNSRLQSESFTPEAVTAAYVAGLAALQEQAERENPAPLTLEQVKQMRGKPVWCQEAGAYGIITMDKIGQWANKPFFQFFWLQDEDAPCGVDCEWNIEERGLTIYQYKPPEKGGGGT